MCTSLQYKVAVIACLVSIPCSAMVKHPLAEKLPGQTLEKHLTAFWDFDQKGPSLRANRIQSPLRMQFQGARYTAEGLDNGALRFNGTSGKFMVPIQATNDLTLSVWFCPSEFPRTDPIPALALQSNQHRLTISLHQNGSIEIQQTQASSRGSFSVGTGRMIPTGQWVHLAVVAGPQELRLYVNGQSAGHFNVAVPLARATLQIAGETYRGKIDEVALWGQSLQSEDIGAVFAMHSPPQIPGVVQRPRADTWEAKAAAAYSALTEAVNASDWSRAEAEADALSDLIAAALKDKKSGPKLATDPTVRANLAEASNHLKSFGQTIRQAKYRRSSSLFDQLDEVWEGLEGQLSLPTPQEDGMMAGPWNQSSGNSALNPGFGGGFAGGMAMGGGGQGNSFSGGGFSMSSSFGPNGQVQFWSSAAPGAQGFNQSGMLTGQPFVWMHTQRIQMTLMPLKMALQNGQWQMTERHATQLQKRLSEASAFDAQPANARGRRRMFGLRQLPPAQRAAMKTQIQKAIKHMTPLHAAIKKRDQQTALKHLQSVEQCVQNITGSSNAATPLGQPSK